MILFRISEISCWVVCVEASPLNCGKVVLVSYVIALYITSSVHCDDNISFTEKLLKAASLFSDQLLRCVKCPPHKHITEAPSK